MTRFRLALALFLALALLASCTATRGFVPAATPTAVVDELLAADRAFATAAAQTDLITALSAMFTRDVIMPVAGSRFAEGRDAAVEALRGTADNARSRLEWTPIRGGVSADGQHGFTFGYATQHRPDGSTMPQKYLAYWIKQPEGWRVAAYKRRPAQQAPAERVLMAHAMPARLVSITSDSNVIRRYRDSLEQAEAAFSREAQNIGLGPAFARYGRPDAVNMGNANDAAFVIGNDSIAKSVSAGGPPNASPFSWSADKVIVASSGDLGITFGMIRRNNAPAGTNPFPFFTIWARDNPTHPWRYIAE